MRTEGRENPQNTEDQKNISLGQNRAHKPGEFKL